MYDDDAAPDSATGLAAQDTAVTNRASETTTLIRVLLDMTGDVAADGYDIEGKLTGDPDSAYEAGAP